MTETADIVVIGAGIAGASAAAELAGERSVIVLEMEERPGYHSTGRSAAMYVPTYGPPAILALTRASGPFFHAPPEGFVEAPMLSKRGIMMLALPSDEEEVVEARELGFVDISLDEAKRRVPLLKTDAIASAMMDEAAEDIDVDIVHQGFLRKLKRGGGRVVCDAKVTGMTRNGSAWQVETKAGRFEASVIVDAAGAWADEVAGLAGAARRGLTPKRRSAALFPAPADVSRWPLTFGAGETFYFKPSSGKLMISPADATPVEPHDVWADDMKLAEAIERYQAVIDHEVTRLDHTWAGLRTFAPDGDPVVGYDPEVEGFFWLAGQGGYGIQTSPALSRTAAALVRGERVPADIAAHGVKAEALSPRRFA
jgi:D-arginine dehydrogenase